MTRRSSLAALNYRVSYTDAHGITYTAWNDDVNRAALVDGPVLCLSATYPDGTPLSPGHYEPARHFVIEERSAAV